jgi:hypothetical protein
MSTGHSNHFQVGSDNPKVDPAKPVCHILLSLWHFHFWKQSRWEKMQLDVQFSQCPAAVECPESKLLTCFSEKISPCSHT